MPGTLEGGMPQHGPAKSSPPAASHRHITRHINGVVNQIRKLEGSWSHRLMDHIQTHPPVTQVHFPAIRGLISPSKHQRSGKLLHWLA